ncbi:HNH endonuclease [Mycobacterium sp.]|uniref:HNH endonuclease n=1 Tax=Mycobacterium sp. TaxID=1785 RepID=UPI003C77EC70
MNDNDVPDLPDRLEIKITAEDYAKLRELSKTSDIAHCIRCLAPALGGGDPGWGAGGFRNRSTGDEMRYAHRLALSAVVGPCPPVTECCHWDDDKANNNVWNLRWASRSANIKDCVRNGSHNMTHRTHCARGHAYSPENTRILKPEGRRCGTCVRQDCRRYPRNSYRLEEEVRRRHTRRRAPFKEAV